MERTCLWLKPTQRKVGSKDGERQILYNSVGDSESSHTWTLYLNFSVEGANKFLCLVKPLWLFFLPLVTKWTLIHLIYLCQTWGRIQVKPLEILCIIKSGSLSAHRGRCKRLQEDKSSQGKEREETSKDKHLNGSEGHTDIVSLPISFTFTSF